MKAPAKHEFRVLGPLEVWVNGEPLALGGPRAKQRAVLGCLLVHAGEAVSVDVLIDSLWGEGPPETAKTILQGHVAQLRRLLEPERRKGEQARVLVTQAASYLLRVEDGAFDRDRFESLLSQGREALVGSRLPQAAGLLREALALWRGPAFGDLAYEPWARPEAERLEELRVECLEERVEADLRLGRHARLVAELEALVAEQPLRERPRGQLMLALYRSGRQADALRAYQEARRMLVDELGVDPSPELRELEAAILRQEQSLRVETEEGTPPSNLPALPTPLIGRERELNEAALILANPDVRLLTMTGPGGIGKTRLALALADRVGEEFRDGVFLCELAPIHESLLALGSINQTLELEEAGSGSLLDDLKKGLRERKLLLVLDNLEQVLGVGPSLAELLAACAGLTLLITSREPLHVAAEHEYPVGPLSIEEAGQLFNERARALRPDFSANGEVGEICERLDRVPLAIELAAARTRALSPAAILERLDKRLPLLTGGPRDAPARHQTLRATIEWSFDLLHERQRLLLQRLAVFAGQFSLEDAEAVCDADLETLAELLDKSLVVSRADGGGRFGLLSTVREFASEQLEESGAADQFRRRHAQHVLDEVERSDGDLGGPDQVAALNAIAERQDDVRAALSWAVSRGDGELARELTAAAGWFWFLRGHLAEGRRWAEDVLSLPGERARLVDGTACMRAGAIADAQADLAAAERFYAEGLAVRRRLGDRVGTAAALNNLGNVALHAGDYVGARRRYEESLNIARELGDQESAGAPLHGLASVELAQGDPASAIPLLEESLAFAEVVGNRYGEAVVRGALGAAHLDLGRFSEAAKFLTETVRLQRELDEPYGIASSLDELAALALATDDPSAAARRLGAAAAIRSVLGSGRGRSDDDRARRTESEVRTWLGDETYEEAWAEGRRLDLEKAVAFAEREASG